MFFAPTHLPRNTQRRRSVAIAAAIQVARDLLAVGPARRGGGPGADCSLGDARRSMKHLLEVADLRLPHLPIRRDRGAAWRAGEQGGHVRRGAATWTLITPLLLALLGCVASGGSSDAGDVCPGLTAYSGGCDSARVALSCTNDAGAGCGCFASAGSAGCPGCGPSEGYSCKSDCAEGQFALACSSLPFPDGGARPSSAPAGCTQGLISPSSLEWCCPCE